MAKSLKFHSGKETSSRTGEHSVANVQSIALDLHGACFCNKAQHYGFLWPFLSLYCYFLPLIVLQDPWQGEKNTKTNRLCIYYKYLPNLHLLS